MIYTVASIGDWIGPVAGIILLLAFVGWLIEGLWFKRPGR